MRVIPVLLMVCLSAPAALRAQQEAARGTATISGRVVNEITGEGIRKAQVTIYGGGMDTARPSRPGSAPRPEPRVVTSDASGNFVCTGLEAGTYSLSVNRDGFRFSSQRPGERLPLHSVTLAASESKSGVELRLQPLGVIAGRILDQDGDPVRRANVNTLAWQYTQGGRVLAPRGNAFSDDRGEYRLFDVPPGRYYLQASTGQMMAGPRTRRIEEQSPQPTFYPGVTEAAAAPPVEVRAGQQLTGMDITLRTGHNVKVRGRITNATGTSNLMLELRRDTRGGSSTSSFTPDEPDGRFTLSGLAPGDYTIGVRANAGDKNLVARAAITVGGSDVEGVDLTLVPPVTISGRVRVEGSSEIKPRQIWVQLQSATASGVQNQGSRLADDNAFSFKDLAVDTYHVQLLFLEQAGLFLKSARWGDQDVMEAGVDTSLGASAGELVLTLSANGAQIEGTVVDEKSELAKNALVVLLPASAPSLASAMGGQLNTRRAESLLRSAGTDAAGHFVLKGVAPGNYKLLAWERIEPYRALYDADLLKSAAAQAESVNVVESDRKTVHLKLLPAPEE